MPEFLYQQNDAKLFILQLSLTKSNGFGSARRIIYII